MLHRYSIITWKDLEHDTTAWAEMHFHAASATAHDIIRVEEEPELVWQEIWYTAACIAAFAG